MNFHTLNEQRLSCKMKLVLSTNRNRTYWCFVYHILNQHHSWCHNSCLDRSFPCYNRRRYSHCLNSLLGKSFCCNDMIEWELLLFLIEQFPDDDKEQKHQHHPNSNCKRNPRVPSTNHAVINDHLLGQQKIPLLHL